MKSSKSSGKCVSQSASACGQRLQRTILFVVLLNIACALSAAEYSTYIGDTADYHIARIRTDSAGNTYISGSRVFGSLSEIFVKKLDPSGQTIFFTTLNGQGNDVPSDLTIDSAGNIYVAGETSSPNFPLHNAFQSSPGPGFLVKLSGDASELIYSTYFPAVINALDVDASGNVYVTGTTDSVQFPVTPGLSFGSVSPDSAPPVFGAFITKLAAAGDRVMYSAMIVGNGWFCGTEYCGIPNIYTTGAAIAIDPAGNAYVAGNTNTVEFPTTTGALLTHGTGAFAAKVNAAGTALSYCTFLGPTELPFAQVANTAYAIAVDTEGNAYVAGSTSDPKFPATPGAYQTSLAAGVNPFNAFVAKLSPSGSSAVWATYLGGKGVDSADAIALDAFGIVWVAGTTTSPDFPNAQGWSQGGDFLVGLTPAGSTLAYAARYPNGTVSQAVSADSSGLLHVGGPAGLVSTVAPKQPPAMRIFGIANAAAGPVGGRVAPMEVISIYGPHIGPATPATATPISSVYGRFFPTELAGVQVSLGGNRVPLLYVSDSQINAMASGGGVVRISFNGKTSPDFPAAVIPAAPEIFQNPDGSAAAVNQDGSINSPTHPAKLGSMVSIWVTGTGAPPVFLQDLQDGKIVTAAESLYCCEVEIPPYRYGTGMPLNVLYDGTSPGIVAGVVQINFQLPTVQITGIPQPDGTVTVPVAVRVGDRLSAAAQVYFTY